MNNVKISTTFTLDTCYAVYKYYEDILNSYVSDYYVDGHWRKLPKSWQNRFNNVDLNEIAELLDLSKSVKNTYPLSLLCLRKLIVYNMIPRNHIHVSHTNHITDNRLFIKYFWKGVKLKKRHEIDTMAQLCYKTAAQTNCFYIVDVGSGLGHLSRMLSYGYGFKVCTFEANTTLSQLAEKLDEDFENVLYSKVINHSNAAKTIHVNQKINTDIGTCEFVNTVRNIFQNDNVNFKFGIVGLHPCGNLGSTLLRLYNECPNVAFINIASCCYMKLTLLQQSQTSPLIGFPLSNYCRTRGFDLSYLSCEIACHAIENYVKKIRESKNICELKIHSYRAALEKLLVSMDEKFKHSPVCSIKYTENLSFKHYCDITLRKTETRLCEDDVILFERQINSTWKNVVAFYSFRLLLAPLVETIILLDRLLYIEESEEESNSYCDIIPLFDCNVSPRNHVLSATRRD